MFDEMGKFPRINHNKTHGCIAYVCVCANMWAADVLCAHLKYTIIMAKGKNPGNASIAKQQPDE